MFKSPTQSNARQLGALYLLYFATAVTGGLLVKGFAVPGDAAATTRNLAAHHVAVNLSSALGLISIIEYLALTALFYELFRSISRPLALLATLLSVTACAIQALSNLFLAPLPGLASTNGGVWTADMNVLAHASLEMQAHVLSTALVLFGAFDLVIGVLIFQSRFLPRPIGVLMMLSGLGWLAYLWPPAPSILSQVIQPLGFLSELLLMIWLLAKGVDEQRWCSLQPETPR